MIGATTSAIIVGAKVHGEKENGERKAGGRKEGADEMPRWSNCGTVTRKAANAFILIGGNVLLSAWRLPRRKDADVSSASAPEDNLRIHCKCDARNEWLPLVIAVQMVLTSLWERPLFFTKIR